MRGEDLRAFLGALFLLGDLRAFFAAVFVARLATFLVAFLVAFFTLFLTAVFRTAFLTVFFAAFLAGLRLVVAFTMIKFPLLICRHAFLCRQEA